MIEPKAPQDVVDIAQLDRVTRHAVEPMEKTGERRSGVLLDTPEQIARLAPALRQQAALTHAMPPNGFQRDRPMIERKVLARWPGVESGIS